MTLRELNRALLARQLLLERQDIPIPEAIERVAGLQAQLPKPPYIGLWSRLRDFDRDDLSRLIETKRVVRATMMRHTVHMVTARDFLRLRTSVQPALDASLGSATGKRLAGVGLDQVLEAAREELKKGPRTPGQLREVIAGVEPHGDLSALGYAVRTKLPLVGVPPGGTWDHGGPPAYALAEDFLGKKLGPDDPKALVLAYLRAFGPASTQDATAWSGRRGLGETIDALRPRLRTFRTEWGQELLDVKDGPLPDADTPAPARLLPDYDNLILSHADRTRVIADAHRGKVSLKAARVLAAFTVDGFVAGTWKLEKRRGGQRVLLSPFKRLARADRQDLDAEAESLGRFLRTPVDVRLARS